MNKKYLVVAGKVVSRYDGDIHRISCTKLCELYKVNSKDCLFADEDKPETFLGMNLSQFEKVLRPQYSGNYSL